MNIRRYLNAEAERVAALLARRKLRIVFAESCTGGLISASLARIPGISEWLCGSAVTYRNATKHGWLGIPAPLLASPGPVSEPVARKMAEGVLQRTPEAQLSAAITGHLGPGAPKTLDGVVYIAVSSRTGSRITTHVRRLRILPQSNKAVAGTSAKKERKLREERQLAASLAVLFMVRSLLESAPKSVKRAKE